MVIPMSEAALKIAERVPERAIIILRWISWCAGRSNWSSGLPREIFS